MCLVYDTQATADYRKWRECRGMKRVRVWKVLNVNLWTLRSLCYTHTTWHSGWNKSNRKSVELRSDCGDYHIYGGKRELRYGIHVYLKKPHQRATGSRCRVVPMTACLKDLVGVNVDKSKAVFMKVWLAKADYDKAMEG